MSAATTAASTRLRISSDGAHFFDRISGGNLLIDELTFPEDQWHRAPRFVSVALTNVCDLACSYCYAPKDRATLAFDDVIRWATEIDAEGCLGIGFGGGEPTLHRRFVEICEVVGTRTGLAVSSTTHGHRLTPALADRLRGSVHFLRISVDGAGETYARLRGRPFDRVRDALEVAATIAPIGINVVVNEDTIEDLSDIAGLAAEFEAAELLLLPERQTTRSRGASAVTLRMIADWVYAYDGPTRLAISETSKDLVATADPFITEQGLRAYAHVDARGFVRRTSTSKAAVEIADKPLLQAIDELAHLKERE